ncbi:MAG: hypothetical protein A2170_05640 [Deltaproteobacteria bacterium RBG_13_53_10]|nr:MAG: hypothetical protein A2170_05640 [Deltaproteobacteria bacterium RBG_13_53_10]
MDRITGIVVILLSCFLLWSLRNLPFEAAAFPVVLFIILIFLSSFLIFGRWKGPYIFENRRDVAVGALVMVAYSLLLPLTGFPFTTGVMLWASMWLGGYRGPKYKLPLFAAVLAGCIYWIFFKLLGVPEP